MIIKLSDTQLIILSRACAREDRSVLPLPDTLKGGAVSKVVQSLINKGLVAETPALPGQPRWREDDEGAVTLVATDAAFEAVGIDLPPAPSLPDSPESDLPAPAAPAPTRPTRENTKQAQLIAMLKEGATVDEIAAACAWQKHTVRGAIAGALKKRLGLTITSEKIKDRGRVYRLCGAPHKR